MALPTLDIYRMVMQRIVRNAFLAARSRTIWLVVFIGVLTTLFTLLFRLLLYVCDIPVIDLSTIETVFSPFLDNPLAQVAAYVFALDKIGPVADFIIGWLFLFFALLPVVTPLVLGAYLFLAFRRAIRSDVVDLTE